MVSDRDLVQDYIKGIETMYNKRACKLKVYTEEFLEKIRGNRRERSSIKLPSPRRIRVALLERGFLEGSLLFRSLDKIGLFVEDGENKYCQVPDYSGKGINWEGLRYTLNNIK